MDESEVLEHVVPGELAGERVDRCAVALAGGRLSRNQVQGLIEDGDLLLDGIQIRASTRARAGQKLVLYIPPSPPSTVVPQDIPLDIVYEDEELIVVNKQAGLVVHPAAGHPDGTLVNALMFHRGICCGEPGRPGIVHRLDRDTSGLMLVAKTDRTVTKLGAMIAARQITREYLAIVRGSPPLEATIETPYGRSPMDRKKFTTRIKGDVRALTRCRVEKRLAGGEASLVRCILGTGRTHQIRVHLSESGWPLVGDPVYGGKPSRKGVLAGAYEMAERTMLHATHLELSHPQTGGWLDFTRPTPADFLAVLDLLAGSA